MNNSDLIIIGSGPGGYRAAHFAATNGLSVVIIEAKEAGGTCLNRGCIPTKTLCRNAEVVETVRKAAAFGAEASLGSIDFAKVMERKDQVVSQLRSGIELLMQTPGITFVKGTASFKDAHTVAGVIGMEFASIFSSLGSEVKVIEFLKECLPTLDSDIAKRLRQAISKRGVDFSMQSGVKSIREENAEDGSRQLVVTFEKKGKASEVSADIVLVATGRRAVVEGLNLEAAGIECGRTGIVVDDNFQTNVEGVYAIGDVNGRCMLAHAATFQGLHVVRRILGKEDNIRFDIMPSAIFTTPEAASVGKSEDNLKDAGTEYVCRKGFYRSNGKALAMDATDGMIKLFVTPEDGRILGCHAYGAHSSDIIQEVAALMNKDATVSELADIIHTHPTLSEVLHDISL